MLKSCRSLLATRLDCEKEVRFLAYKAWLSALTDWVFGDAQLPLEMIDPNSLRSVMIDPNSLQSVMGMALT